MLGVQLLLLHPELPTCGDCQRWMYTESWRCVKRQGRLVPRPSGTPTPCYRCPKIPVDAIPLAANAVSLSAKNHQTYQLYLQIKAGRPMPDDAIVRQNCGFLRQVEDDIHLMLLRAGITIQARERDRDRLKGKKSG